MNELAFQVPPLISTPMREENLSWRGRSIALAICAGCLAVLVMGLILTPSPSGVGTHTPLGMGECAWLVRYHLPCPSCGMTTSFAWFVRGNWIASVYVQPFGFALAIGTAILFWASLYIGLTGKPVGRLLSLIPAKYTWVLILALAVGAWGWKIFIRLQGIDGWK